MKKYLGSKITAYAAVVSLFFIFAPLMFGLYLLCFVSVNAGSIFFVVAGIGCACAWGVFIKKESIQLFSWGTFQDKGVQIKTIFSKPIFLDYEKCKYCGIGYYVHGILNSKAGSNVFFIFLSYDAFDEAYRSKMNLWKPSKTRIKVGFNKKLYNHLITVLPKKQALKLIKDYETLIQ
ncbi:MAG: hypothetical protein E7670_01710 [Ruminococcaceae bacterium]|nr:hypothetical protein [Oscillospiraceae bacterium]